MKNLYLLLCAACVSLSACNSTPNASKIKADTQDAVTNSSPQIIETIQYEGLQSVINKQDDVLYVVNFWATWCVPCVEELPYFMEVNQEFSSNPNYKMILVNLDKSSDLETKVKPFIDKNDIPTDVYLLDDVKRTNEWIPAFDENWTGSIPATIFIKNGKKLAFREGQISKKELQQLVQQNLH